MKNFKIISLIMAMCILLASCTVVTDESKTEKTTTPITTAITITTTEHQESDKEDVEENVATESFSLDEIGDYDGNPYVVINNNIPSFTDADYTTESFEEYGDLDYLGRCTAAYACIGTDIMPTEERGSIGSVKPTGWHTVKYDCVDGKYLYNRCHLIGYQLSAENANDKNLITGTRYLNVTGMLGFENEVADYVKSTDNHVLYRVTPVFVEDELVARGVLIEAKSVEDKGKGICFYVYCYNVQPSITIDYATGESESKSEKENNKQKTDGEKYTYIVNINSNKFHYETCSSVSRMKEENKKQYYGYRTSLINNGYEPCKQCNP